MVITDVHIGLNFSDRECKQFFVRGSYEYYHYTCDGYNDVGWGCGYRTLQTICSWILNQKQAKLKVPSLREIQQCLVDIGDKTYDFIDSHQWIGSVEISFCLEKLYNVQSRILHVNSLQELSEKIHILCNHMESFGSPIMMGGDKDASSKAIFGILCGQKNYFLIVDPHNVNVNVTKCQLQAEGWVRWCSVESFDNASFYNFCCPLLKAKELL